MDPNETLTEMLALASAVIDAEDDSDEANSLANAILDLDEWICKGGFLPERWSK